MEEPGINRRILQIISTNSDLQEEEIKEQFKAQGIYADKGTWAKFIHIALLSMGAAFAVAGIVFFLAYNWHLINKFVKLGLVQALVAVLAIASYIFREKVFLRNILLMCASFLVGAVFSVFGQIYQTGADAYDFFLGWTVFMLVWALIADFPPLWLLAIGLINLSFSLYVDQVAKNLTTDVKYLVLFVFNTLALIALQTLSNRSENIRLPSWLYKLISVSIVVYITIGMGNIIFSKYNPNWLAFFVPASLTYAFAIYRSFKIKSLFHLCIVPLSIIILICCLIGEKISNDMGALFFFLSIFVIASVTVLSKWLINLNKKWNG